MWLSGLPTERSYDKFFKPHRFALQVCCFNGSPAARKSGGSNGILLPTALQVNIDMDTQKTQGTVKDQLLGHIHLIISSLLSGDNVLVQCWAGNHRGPIIAAAVRGSIMNESFDQAQKIICSVRASDIKAGLAHYGGEQEMDKWANDMVKECQAKTRSTIAAFGRAKNNQKPLPQGWGYSSHSVTTYTHAVVQSQQTTAEHLIPMCMYKQSSTRDNFKDPVTTKDDAVAIQWGRELCRNCAAILPASWRVKAGYGPQSTGQIPIQDHATLERYEQYRTSEDDRL